MTEMLTRLLHDEVDDLDVPPAPTQQILARGGRTRRRRAQVRLATASCVAAACAVAFLAVHDRPGDERRLDGDVRIADTARALSSYASDGAWAVGDEIVIGANRFTWHEPIKALHYTSAGVVIQSGDNPDRDEGGSAYALVTPTGEWSPIDVELDDQVVGFETSSSRFAYAEPGADGGFDLVVHDAASDEEVARTTVELPTTTIGWRAPPVAIHDDTAWIRGDDGWIEWNWRTGTTSLVPGTTSTYELAGGRYADWQDRERWIIRSMDDQSEVRELDLRRGWYGFLSPDGRYLRAFPNMARGTGPVDFEFFSVATGDAWQLRDVTDARDRVDLGWSPDGHVLQLLDDTLSRCDPDTGTCEELATDVGSGTVRLGGEPYGS